MNQSERESMDGVMVRLKTAMRAFFGAGILASVFSALPVPGLAQSPGDR